MRPDGLYVENDDGRIFVWYGGLDALEAEYPNAHIVRYEDRRPYEGRQPGEPKPEPVSAATSRADLNARAASLGIPDPDKLPNKDAVLAAIEAKLAELNPPPSDEGSPVGVADNAPHPDEEPAGDDTPGDDAPHADAENAAAEVSDDEVATEPSEDSP